MLDEQFFNAEAYRSYLTKNFILFRADYQEEAGKAVFNEYGVRGTPTIMVIQPDGVEIDRITDYDGNPENFKAELESASEGVKTYLALSKAYSEDSENLETTAWLLKKFELRRDLDNGIIFAEKVIARADEAKQMMVPFGPDKAEINAYEFAQFVMTYSGPEYAESFCDEFPESVMRTQLFRNLSRFLSSPEMGGKALEIYEGLFEKYPGDAELSGRYIAFCASSGKNTEQALEVAESVYKVGSSSMERWIAANYAKLLLSKDDLEKAREVYGENFAALFTEGKDADNLNGYAWFWAVEGQNLESAKAAAEKSLEFKDDANTWDTLSMVYWKMGEHQKAIEAEEKALEMVGGKSKEFEERIAKIKEEMESAS
ncbi:MAG: hypothetical protein H8E46_08425 [FCB group bacterium]|nr:hypothetical protein [FCB group bacterium]